MVMAIPGTLSAASPRTCLMRDRPGRRTRIRMKMKMNKHMHMPLLIWRIVLLQLQLQVHICLHKSLMLDERVLNDYVLINGSS